MRGRDAGCAPHRFACTGTISYSSSRRRKGGIEATVEYVLPTIVSIVCRGSRAFFGPVNPDRLFPRRCEDSTRCAKLKPTDHRRHHLRPRTPLSAQISSMKAIYIDQEGRRSGSIAAIPFGIPESAT